MSVLLLAALSLALAQLSKALGPIVNQLTIDNTAMTAAQDSVLTALSTPFSIAIGIFFGGLILYTGARLFWK